MGDAIEVKKAINPEEIVKELNSDETLELCKSIGITFEDVKLLAQKNREYSNLEKDIKPLKDKIKSALLNANAKKGAFGDINLSITIQNRDTMDEDKLVEILKSKGLFDAVITVEKPDANKLAGLIASGDLTDEDFASCMIPNKVAILNFPKVKKSVKSVEQEPVVNLNTKKPSMF